MRALILVLAGSLAGCQVFGSRPDPATGLLEADRTFAARSLERGAAEAFRIFMAPDGMRLAASGPAVTGPDAIRAELQAEPARVLAWQPQLAEVSRDGDLGWTWGEWQAYEPGAGGKRLARGRYVNVWKRQPDGQWKVRLDIGNVVREKGTGE